MTNTWYNFVIFFRERTNNFYIEIGNTSNTDLMMEIVNCDPVDYSSDINKLIRGNNQGPIPCPECGKFFAKEFDIKRHMFTHTGEKPFKV